MNETTRIEQAETRTELAETRTDLAETRTQLAEARSEQAETRTEQAKTRTEQAERRTEEAETRTEQVKTRMDQAESRTEEAEARSEMAIRASEVRYRRLFETAQDGILLLDAETGQVVDANPFMKNLLGYSQEEFLGRKLWEIGPFKGEAASKIAFAELQHADRLRYEGLPLETADGRRVEVEFISNAYLVDRKRVIQCNIRDITERKRTEMTSLWLAAIVASSDDAIIGKDLRGVVTSWNAAAEREFGYSAAEMIGQSITRLVPAERHEEEVKILSQIARGKSVRHFETMRLRKDGSTFNVSVTVSAIKDSGGKIVGASKVVRDISLRKKAEETIHRLNAGLEQRVIQRTAELEAANQELDAFSYSVSHDLRAPLRAVDGFSRAVLEDYGPQLPDKCRGYLETIREGTQRMGTLIDDLLAFSQLSRTPLKKSEVNTGKLVHAVLEDLRSQQGERQIDLRIEELPTCEGDPALLKQVWINLLLNAFKYTRARAQAVIEIGCKREPVSGPDPGEPGKQKDEDVYFVRDNGTGFDMRYADKLFGVFQRLHREDEYEGTGVGLAIVQRIVHRHGGRVWAEAAVDHGAIFYFTLAGRNKS
jgi:PAS domain S-box-containing protein